MYFNLPGHKDLYLGDNEALVLPERGNTFISFRLMDNFIVSFIGF